MQSRYYHSKNCWVTSTTSGLPQLHVSDVEDTKEWGLCREWSASCSKKKLLDRRSEMLIGFNIMREKPYCLGPGPHNTCKQLRQQMKLKQPDNIFSTIMISVDIPRWWLQIVLSLEYFVLWPCIVHVHGHSGACKNDQCMSFLWVVTMHNTIITTPDSIPSEAIILECLLKSFWNHSQLSETILA